ncbi:hypothetical protein DV738_g2479, partial [Chaetothyriales sp. CBS 135597]
MANSYRPSKHKKHGGNDNTDSYRPDYARGPPTKRRRTDRYTPSAAAASTRPSGPTHSKKERATNPSTRIHSLKKLLARDILPPEEKREKERELAGLLHDQAKARVTRTKRQVLQRYHMVRFFERKKAERKLKRLLREKKELETALGLTTKDEDSGKRERLTALEKQVHEAQVDLNYALYSPLGEKYIGIFADEKADGGHGNEDGDKKSATTTTTHDDEITTKANEESGVVKLAGVGQKPPMWFEIEKCMQAGGDEAAVKRRLEALRDRLPAQIETVAVRSAGEASAAAVKTGKDEPDQGQTKPAWLEEDGHIDQKDLDSDGDDVMGDGGFFEH